MQIRDFFESTSSWPSRLTFAVEKRLAVNAQSVPLVRNLLRHHIFRDQFVQMRNHLKQGTGTTSEIPTKDRQARAVFVRHNISYFTSCPRSPPIHLRSRTLRLLILSIFRDFNPLDLTRISSYHSFLLAYRLLILLHEFRREFCQNF